MTDDDAISHLFSTLITIYILVLLYFPSPFSPFIFSSSPVVISTVVLCLNILRLGASSPTRNPTSSSGDFGEIDEARELASDDTVQCSSVVSESFHEDSFSGSDQSFVEWDVRAPLEVIYEEYDEEEDEDMISEEKRREADMDIIKRYASLSLFYPETDSDESSEGDFPITGIWESPEEMGFRWEEDDGDGGHSRDGLIEIALEDQKKIDGGSDDDDDDVSLIEIDLSSAR